MSRITKLFVAIIIVTTNSNNIIIAQRFVDPYYLPQSITGRGHLREESRFTKVIQNARLRGHAILIKFNVSTVQECLYEASYIVDAVQLRQSQSSVRKYRSVNYNGDTRTCEINNFKNKNIMANREVMVEDPGWTYYEKDSGHEVRQTDIIFTRVIILSNQRTL